MTSSRSAAADAHSTDPVALRVLKKYPNCRLYDTSASSDITLAVVKPHALSDLSHNGSGGRGLSSQEPRITQPSGFAVDSHGG